MRIQAGAFAVATVLILASADRVGSQNLQFSEPRPLNAIPQTPTHLTDIRSDFDPQLATDGNGLWLAVWRSLNRQGAAISERVGDTFGPDSDILFARSTDDGRSWSLPAPLHNAVADEDDDVEPRLATDGAGVWIALWRTADEHSLGLGEFDSDLVFRRSTDGGLTWSPVAPLNSNARDDGPLDNDFDAEIASDGAGGWIAIWTIQDRTDERSVTEARVVAARSIDGGATWSAPAPIHASTVDPAVFNRTATIESFGPGSYLAAWSSTDDLGGTIDGDGDILMSRTTDGGATWSAPAPLNANAADDPPGTEVNESHGDPIGLDLEPQLATDGQGRWIAIWLSTTDLNGEIGTQDFDVLGATSADNGVTWSEPFVLDPELATDTLDDDLDITIETDGSGAWMAASRRGSINVYRSIDDGATWSVSRPWPRLFGLSQPQHPAFAADGRGRWLLAVNAAFDFQSHTGFTNPPNTWDEGDILYIVSDDGGATWGDLAPLNANAFIPTFTLDGRTDQFPRVAVGPSGTTMAVWATIFFGSHVSLSRSIDGGASWAQSISLNNTFHHYDPEIAAGPDGVWIAAWHFAHQFVDPQESIRYSRSTDDGLTWGSDRNISFRQNERANNRFVDLAADAAGNWIMVWATDRSSVSHFLKGDDDDLVYVRSTDNGESWSLPELLSVDLAVAEPGAIDTAPQIAVSAAGTWIVVWHSTETLGDSIGPEYDILFSRSTDVGATWSAPAPLNTNAAVDFGGDARPQVLPLGGGVWLATWWSNDALDGTIGTDGDILFARSTDDGLTWSAPAPLNTDAATDLLEDGNFGFTGDRPNIATDGAGDVVAVWGAWHPFAPDDNDIRWARSTDFGATWSAPAFLNDGENDSGIDNSPDIAFDRGRWIGVWATTERSLVDSLGAPWDIAFARAVEDFSISPAGSWDFTKVFDDGGAWQSGVIMGSGSVAADPAGLCMTVPAEGDNIVGWAGPERMIDLIDNSVYRVRVRLTTDQTEELKIPIWSMAWDNYRADRGVAFGGEAFFLDSAGGANGIGRAQGRDSFDIYISPTAAETPQWRGLLGDGGAFDPAHDDVNDIRLVFRLLDLESSGNNSRIDEGTVCIESIQIDRIAIDAIESAGEVFAPPISSATHAPFVFGEAPLSAAIDEGAKVARYALGLNDKATLIPHMQSLSGLERIYPVEWESETLYRVSARVQSGAGSSESDPVDRIGLFADTATNEVIQNSYVLRGAEGMLDRAGSPRLPEEAGGAQTYSMFFFSQNATVSPLEHDNRLRGFMDLTNRASLYGEGAGSDPVEAIELKVERMVAPPG